MKLSIFGIVITIFFSACMITNTPGFYSGYKQLNKTTKERVVYQIENEHQQSLYISKDSIYAITGNQLLRYIQQWDTTIVYFWSVNCNSDVCMPIYAAQAYCDKKGYKLVVIQEYYDKDLWTRIQQNSKTSIFMVNQHYYKTDYCNKYLRLFLKDLDTKTVLRKQEFGNRYYIFSKDSLIKSIARI